MINYCVIKRALEIYDEARGYLNRLSVWVSGEPLLIANVKTFAGQLSSEGCPHSETLTSEQMYRFIYLVMPINK